MIKFTCIICFHKFNQDEMDCEERICNECINNKEEI